MKHKLNIINQITNKILSKIILSRQIVGPTILAIKASGRPEKKSQASKRQGDLKKNLRRQNV